MTDSSIERSTRKCSPGSTSKGDMQLSLPEGPLLLTVREAAALIGVGRTTLYRLMDNGQIESVHVGASRRIPLHSAYEFVDRIVRPTIS